MLRKVLIGTLIFTSHMAYLTTVSANTTLQIAVNYYDNNGVIAKPYALIVGGNGCSYAAKALPLNMPLSSDWQYDNANYIYHQTLTVDTALIEFDGCKFMLATPDNGTYNCLPNPFKITADSKLMNILNITVQSRQQCSITQSWNDPPLGKDPLPPAIIQ